MRSFLSRPAAYLLWQTVIGGRTGLRTCIEEYGKPGLKPARVLDVGCGPGHFCECFPDADYSGFDVNPDYIAYASKTYGSPNRRFHCTEFTDEEASRHAPFDMILMIGLLHHLNDDEALALLRRAQSKLQPGGRAITVDGCFVEGQPWIARRLLENDRGEHVRQRASYLALASKVFSSVTPHVRHDLLTIPSTLLIMQLQ